MTESDASMRGEAQAAPLDPRQKVCRFNPRQEHQFLDCWRTRDLLRRSLAAPIAALRQRAPAPEEAAASRATGTKWRSASPAAEALAKGESTCGLSRPACEKPNFASAEAREPVRKSGTPLRSYARDPRYLVPQTSDRRFECVGPLPARILFKPLRFRARNSSFAKT